MADWSGQAWLQGFNDAGLVVFGMSANELVEIKVGTKFSQLHMVSKHSFCRNAMRPHTMYSCIRLIAPLTILPVVLSRIRITYAVFFAFPRR